METDPLVMAARKNLADIEALSARVEARAAQASPPRVATSTPPPRPRAAPRA